MAYRIEGTDIVIDGWEQGIAASPYKGLAEVSYAQVLNYPGEMSVMNPLAEAPVSGATLDLPVHKCSKINSSGTLIRYFMLDAYGQTYYADAGAQSWTFGSQVGAAVSVVGNSGMAQWKGYTIVFRAGNAYYSTSNSLASFTSWGAVPVTNNENYTFIDTEDVLYYCNGTSIGSIIQNPGKTFDPTDATTYTANGSAFQLPSGMLSTCLEQLGSNLLIGTTTNKVIPWDRISANVSSTNQPLFLGENCAYRMVTANTNTYIFPGHPVVRGGRGYIYVTNGSQVSIFAKMPDSFNDTQGTYTPEPYWTFGDAMYHRNKLFFGAKSASGTGGVWMLDLQTGVITRANLFSINSSTLVTVINSTDTDGLGPNPPYGYGYWCGGGTQASTCKMNYTASALSTSAVVISDKIPVGTFLKKKTFNQVEVKLAKALVSGETVTLEYISDLGTGTIGTFTSADGGVGKVFPVNFQTGQWLQLKATLTPTNTNPTYVRLKELRLRAV